MTEYRIQNIKDHILIESNGELLLIDTGSPVSFSENGHLTLCGEDVTVPTSLMGTNMQYVSDKLGVHVNGLVGMDYIGNHSMSIDVNAGVLVFDCDTDGYSRIPNSTSGVHVKFGMEVDGKKAGIILDTGAPTSYISKKFTAGKTPVDNVSDFSPYCGNFTTPVYELDAALCGRRFSMRAGNLPDVLGLAVNIIADGVFGMDFLRHFKVLVSRDGVWVQTA